MNQYIRQLLKTFIVCCVLAGSTYSFAVKAEDATPPPAVTTPAPTPASTPATTTTTTPAPTTATPVPTSTQATGNVGGIGEVAENFTTATESAIGLVGGASITLGLGLLLAAFIRYRQHLVNPLAHPISTVVVMVILGLALAILPFFIK